MPWTMAEQTVSLQDLGSNLIEWNSLSSRSWVQGNKWPLLPESKGYTKEYTDCGARHLGLLIWILLCRKSKILQVGNKKRNTHTHAHTWKTKKSQTLTNILRASCLCGSYRASKIRGRGSLSLLEHLTLKSSLRALLSLSDPVHLSVPVMGELAPSPKSLRK